MKKKIVILRKITIKSDKKDQIYDTKSQQICYLTKLIESIHHSLNMNAIAYEKEPLVSKYSLIVFMHFMHNQELYAVQKQKLFNSVSLLCMPIHFSFLLEGKYKNYHLCEQGWFCSPYFIHSTQLLRWLDKLSSTTYHFCPLHCSIIMQGTMFYIQNE